MIEPGSTMNQINSRVGSNNWFDYEPPRSQTGFKTSGPVLKTLDFVNFQMLLGKFGPSKGLSLTTLQQQLDLCTVVVYLSLWDEAAATFRGLLSSGNKTQSVNPKIIESGKLAYAGYLYLNSTPASKFYFDRNIPAIEEFTSRLQLIMSWFKLKFKCLSIFVKHTFFLQFGRCSSRGIPCIDTMEGIKKKELVSIGDLNTFISNSSDQLTLRDCNKFTNGNSFESVKTEEADFLCKALVVGVLQQNGWSHRMRHEVRQIWHFPSLQQMCFYEHYRGYQVRSLHPDPYISEYPYLDRLNIYRPLFTGSVLS
ncbi:hypothetical protein YC2023_043581 [Brassica napus]